MSHTPPLNWSDIRQRIDKLRLYAEELKAATPDAADFMPAFAAEADMVVEAAAMVGDDVLECAHQLIDEILIEMGYMEPSERQT